MPPISVMIKPASGSCNMRCRYCFYADEQENREVGSYGVMSLPTMRNLIDKLWITRNMPAVSLSRAESRRWRGLIISGSS